MLRVMLVLDSVRMHRESVTAYYTLSVLGVQNLEPSVLTDL